jgi:hypothetical protein
MGLLSEETSEKLERTFAFVTGNHFINYHYGSILSKSLKVLPVRDFDANEIVPNLFLGDVYAAHNTKELKKRKITHIVTCTVGVAPPFPEQFKYMQLKILDTPSENICEYFAQTSHFIGNALENNGRVLVHCIRGVSRSATIVSAYLITAFRIAHHEAVRRVREKRPVARPNYAFMIQLEMYATKVQQMQNGPPSITVADKDDKGDISDKGVIGDIGDKGDKEGKEDTEDREDKGDKEDKEELTGADVGKQTSEPVL